MIRFTVLTCTFSGLGLSLSMGHGLDMSDLSTDRSGILTRPEYIHATSHGLNRSDLLTHLDRSEITTSPGQNNKLSLGLVAVALPGGKPRKLNREEELSEVAFLLNCQPRDAICSFLERAAALHLTVTAAGGRGESGSCLWGSGGKFNSFVEISTDFSTEFLVLQGGPHYYANSFETSVEKYVDIQLN